MFSFNHCRWPKFISWPLPSWHPSSFAVLRSRHPTSVGSKTLGPCTSRMGILMNASRYALIWCCEVTVAITTRVAVAWSRLTPQKRPGPMWLGFHMEVSKIATWLRRFWKTGSSLERIGWTAQPAPMQPGQRSKEGRGSRDETAVMVDGKLLWC